METISAVFGLRGLSARNEGEGGDLWIVLFWLRDQFDGDRRATRQHAEVQGDLAKGTSGDGPPFDLNRESGCWWTWPHDTCHPWEENSPLRWQSKSFIRRL